MRLVERDPTRPAMQRPRQHAAAGCASPATSVASVFVLCEDRLFRDSVCRLLTEAGLPVIGGGAEAAALPGTPVPKVTVLVPAAESDVAATIAAIRNVRPATRVLVLARTDEDATGLAALRGGADGCLGGDLAPEALGHAVALVALGENVMPVRLSAHLLRERTAPADVALTPRERDVLRGLLAGHSNKMIAKTLGTTDMTVKAQLRHLLRKIGAQNRTQAALWAREHGVVSPQAH